MSGEYISREAALKFRLTASLRPEKLTVAQAVADAIAEYIKAIHAADVVEVRHGQWNGGATGWECSECAIESNNTYPHCPYCGAVMDGGQDDGV